MKNGLLQLWQILIYTHVIIALAAIAQCLLTYLVLRSNANVYIVCIEGCATLLLYNLSLWLSRPSDPAASPYRRTRWVFSHMSVFWTNSLLAVGLMGYSLLHVHRYTIAFLGFIGVFSLLYALPIFRFGGRVGGLRQVPGLKLFHIAVLWSLSGVGLPVVELWAEGQPIDWWVANYLGALKVLFLLICTLPFDIRDMQQDSYYHLMTIPRMIGERRAKVMCYGMLVAHVLLVLIAPFGVEVKSGLILNNMLIAAFLRFRLFRRPSHYHQVYLLDVALIAQYLAVLVFTQVR